MKSIRPNLKPLPGEQGVCLTCKDTFVKHTSIQQYCSLKCFGASRHRKSWGVYRGTRRSRERRIDHEVADNTPR